MKRCWLCHGVGGIDDANGVLMMCSSCGGMTPSGRLRDALATLGWSQRSFAPRIGYDERTVRRWASGAWDAPEPVLIWLETLAAFMVANPPPR